MADEQFDFHGTTMAVRAATGDAGAYGLIEMWHPPLVGPARHVHPRGREVFYILAGAYTFWRGNESTVAHAGDVVVIPQGVPHRYQVGPNGGRALVICPPHLEKYFQIVAGWLHAGPVAWGRESTLAAEYGQDFLESSGHWDTVQD